MSSLRVCLTPLMTPSVETPPVLRIVISVAGRPLELTELVCTE